MKLTMSSVMAGSSGGATTIASTASGDAKSKIAAKHQKRQQELYTWLQAEYSQLLKHQEIIKAQDGNVKLRDDYKRRHASYQVKLEEYHQCQKAILETVNANKNRDVVQASAAVNAASKGSSKVATMNAKAWRVAPSRTLSAKNETIKVASSKEVTVPSQTVYSNPREVEVPVLFLQDTTSSITTRTTSSVKRPASDFQGLELKKENEDIKYQDIYQELRGNLLQRCVQLGLERGCGITLWHAYWDGLRSFLLYRSRRCEFENLLVENLALPTDVLRMHNTLVATLLHNVRAEATSATNISLLPFLLTEEELARESGREEEKMKAGHNFSLCFRGDGDLFFPLLDESSWQSHPLGGHEVPQANIKAISNKEELREVELDSSNANVFKDVSSIRPAVLVSNDFYRTDVINKRSSGNINRDKGAECDEGRGQTEHSISKQEVPREMINVKRRASGDSLASLGRDTEGAGERPSPVNKKRRSDSIDAKGVNIAAQDKKVESNESSIGGRDISNTRSGLQKPSEGPTRRSARL